MLPHEYSNNNGKPATLSGNFSADEIARLTELRHNFFAHTEYLERVIDYVDEDPDVFILSNLDNVGSVEINAFQSYADVVMQKSTREGFGLTVTEALWKARPTIGGDVGGIPLQITDGVTGYLVDSIEECARRCLDVLKDPERHREMALLGKEKVRHDFLTPRLLRDELALFNRLLDGAS